MTEPDLVTDLEAFVRRLYEQLGQRNVDALAEALDADARILDERTGRWSEAGAILAMTRAELAAAEEYANRIEQVEARMLAPGIGAVTYDWHGHGVWQGTTYDIRCPSSLVARHDGDRWRIVLMHSVPAEERSRG